MTEKFYRIEGCFFLNLRMLSQNIFSLNSCPPIFVTQIFAPPIFMTSLRRCQGGNNFTETFIHFTYQCMRRPAIIVHCYVLCVLEAGICGLHIFVCKLKRNIMT